HVWSWRAPDSFEIGAGHEVRRHSFAGRGVAEAAMMGAFRGAGSRFSPFGNRVGTLTHDVSLPTRIASPPRPGVASRSRSFRRGGRVGKRTRRPLDPRQRIDDAAPTDDCLPAERAVESPQDSKAGREGCSLTSDEGLEPLGYDRREARRYLPGGDPAGH